MKIVFSMTNDIPFDQRMQKTCDSLSRAGHTVTLIGKQRHSNIVLEPKSYMCRRLNTIFKKGKGFYIEYNLRLFFVLLKTPADIYCAIDTDTLLANYLSTRINRKQLYYDAHEYFTELEELVHRPITRAIWTWVEKLCIPAVDKAYTISQGYADLFQKHYQKTFQVVRNVARLREQVKSDQNQESFILYQGAVNYGRGLESLVEAMQWVDFKLVICGTGDAYQHLQDLSKKHHVSDKIKFTGYLKPDELIHYTDNAKIGITLFSNEGLSNHHSLCNRFFDYLQAGVPQLAMSYPEYIKFNQQFEVAFLLNQLTPQTVAEALQKMISDTELYHKLKTNALKARQLVNWLEEEKALLAIFSSASAHKAL